MLIYSRVYYIRLSSIQRNDQHDDTGDSSFSPGRRANCQRVDHDSAEARRVVFFQQILG